MMQTYKVLNWGEAVGSGINEAVTVTLLAVAKRNNEESPYLVANELVAASIATYLRLPVPPCCIVIKDGVPHFSSLNFNLTGERLPPVDPARVAQEWPRMAAGIVVFDAYIGNYDRHDGNISAVLQTPPHRLNIFDHDRCLLGHEEGAGLEHLEQANYCLVIDGSMGGNQHCLMPHMTDWGHLAAWVLRIEQMPDWFTDEVAQDAGEHGGITEEEVAGVKKFLRERRDNLRGILSAAQQTGAFPALDQRGLF